MENILVCMKCPIYETSRLWKVFLWNVLSMKWPIYEMSYLWNVLSSKCPNYKTSVYEMSFYERSYQWNVLSMKCLIYEMSYPWNVLSVKCPFYEMSQRRNVVPWNYMAPWIETILGDWSERTTSPPPLDVFFSVLWWLFLNFKPKLQKVFFFLILSLIMNSIIVMFFCLKCQFREMRFICWENKRKVCKRIFSEH